ncbi:MAG: methanogenic corrinoid protein MtbC1 [Bradymonadia bacterium]
MVWVQRALADGHRPKQVLGLSPFELQRLLEPQTYKLGPEDSAGEAVVVGQASLPQFERWLSAVRDLDESAFHSLLASDWGRLGTLAFIEQRLAPFLVLVGDLWVRRQLGIRHEHFVSERARDFLVGIWRPLSATRRRPLIVCATLPGELHVLGLHMAACVCAMAGSHVVFLGAGLPIEDIVCAGRDSAADAIVVSVSRNMDRAEASVHLAALSRKAGAMPLVFGGQVGTVPESATFVASLSQLEEWVSDVVHR